MYAGEETPFPIVVDRATTLELCVTALLEIWSEAVVQNSATAEVYGDFASIPFSELQEIMIYRDVAAQRSWNELGAADENRNLMAHLLCTQQAPPRLLLVLDDRTSDEARQIIGVVHGILEEVPEQANLTFPREVSGEAA